MDTKTEPFWLHVYTGKENGLMVVGTKESLRSLGAQLVAAADDTSVRSDAWPPKIAAPNSVGPYKDLPEFNLSFHLKGVAPLEQCVPLSRRAPALPLIMLVVALAIVGSIALVKWAVSGAL